MRFVFDSSVLIDYLHDQQLAADAFARASQMGEVWITISSLLELYLPTEERKIDKKGRRRKTFRTRSKAEIEDDLNKLEGLRQAYDAKVLPIPEDAQWLALNEIAPLHYSTLGKSLLADSLILGCGLREDTWLVTRDRKWFRLARRRRKSLSLRIVDPVRLVQAETLNEPETGA